MIDRLKHYLSGPNSVRSASLIMVVTLLASNLLGLVRDRFLAQKIPTDLLDTYFAAFRIPDLLFNIIILGAVSAAFIPLLADAFRRSEHEAWEFATVTLNSALLLLAGLSLAVVLIMPWLTPLVVPDFSVEKQALTTELGRWLMLQPLCFAVSYLVSGVLNARKRFVSSAIAPLVYNASIIGATIGFADQFSVHAVVIGVVIGAALHALIQLAAVRPTGWHWQPVVSFDHPGLRKLVTLMLPRAIGLGGQQFVLILFTAIASSLAAGSVAIYTFADNIQTVPIAVFGIAFATAIFPTLADQFAARDDQAFAAYVVRGLRATALLTLPSAVGILLLRAQIVRLILGSGYFDWAATEAAAATLGTFALGILASSVVQLLARACYARHDTRRPTTIALVSYAVMVGSGWLFAQWFGVAGLALGFSFGSLVQAIWLAGELWQQVPALAKHTTSLIRFAGQLSGATVVLAVVVQVAKVATVAAGADLSHGLGVLTQTVVAIVAGAVSYGLIVRWLHLPELTLVTELIVRRFRPLSPGEDQHVGR